MRRHIFHLVTNLGALMAVKNVSLRRLGEIQQDQRLLHQILNLLHLRHMAARQALAQRSDGRIRYALRVEFKIAFATRLHRVPHRVDNATLIEWNHPAIALAGLGKLWGI